MAIGVSCRAQGVVEPAAASRGSGRKYKCCFNKKKKQRVTEAQCLLLSRLLDLLDGDGELGLHFLVEVGGERERPELLHGGHVHRVRGQLDASLLLHHLKHLAKRHAAAASQRASEKNESGREGKEESTVSGAGWVVWKRGGRGVGGKAL